MAGRARRAPFSATGTPSGHTGRRATFPTASVMIAIANVIPRPSVQAKRFGFSETQSGTSRTVMARATTPIGLTLRPTVSRVRNSTKKNVETTCSRMYWWLK